MFDEHTDGRFVKYLLVVMLLIASIAQPFSIIYTAYGDKPPTSLWEAVPVLVFLLFIALDWTILPLGYFFSTTAKPSIKFVTAALLVVVAFGAFEGYFTATERLISMRAKEITKLQLALAQADAKLDAKVKERKEKERQAALDDAKIKEIRDGLEAANKRIADQIDRDQATPGARRG